MSFQSLNSQFRIRILKLASHDAGNCRAEERRIVRWRKILIRFRQSSRSPSLPFLLSRIVPLRRRRPRSISDRHASTSATQFAGANTRRLAPNERNARDVARDDGHRRKRGEREGGKQALFKCREEEREIRNYCPLISFTI
ncbi:hypothetical protein PUN28_007463 [Cardiocondyla obscurior]|uniref:Uncharacterized protein n=1 Tax=Cardiocondyla obscurior TaxID=286306 RepID=A0AAW2G5H3_9HYME